MLQEESEEALKLKAQRVAEYSARKSKSKLFYFYTSIIVLYYSKNFRTYSYRKVKYYIGR